MNGSLETKPTRGTFVKSPDFNKKILVVDDESAILQTLRFKLERSGYTVVTASDGRGAVAMAQRESIPARLCSVPGGCVRPWNS